MPKPDFASVSKQLLDGLESVQQSITAHLTSKTRDAILGPTLINQLHAIFVNCAKQLAESDGISDDERHFLGGIEGLFEGCASDPTDVLTNEIAEWYLSDSKSVDLETFTAIENAAAESLCKHRGLLLRLDGLTSLSDGAAENLSRFNGSLTLDGLTSLSDAAAESLSKHRGPISRRSLRSLSDAEEDDSEDDD